MGTRPALHPSVRSLYLLVLMASLKSHSFEGRGAAKRLFVINALPAGGCCRASPA